MFLTFLLISVNIIINAGSPSRIPDVADDAGKGVPIQSDACSKGGGTVLGHISGVVVDAEDDEPLIGVTVSIVGTRHTALTDLDGTFMIRYVPEGDYTLLFSHLDYQSDTLSMVHVKAKETASISCTLKRKTAVDITIESRNGPS